MGLFLHGVRRSAISAAVLMIVAVICGHIARAQNNELITLMLVGMYDHPWSNARVRIEGPSGVREGVTDSGGALRVPLRSISPGEFRITVFNEDGYEMGQAIVTVSSDAAGMTIDGQHVKWKAKTEELAEQEGWAPLVIVVGDLSGGPTDPFIPPPPPPGPDLSVWWNTWVEERRDSLGFKSVDHLKIDQPYSLVVDLATVAYQSAAGLQSEKVGSVLKQLIDRAVQSQTDQLDLDLYLLYDQRYFVPLDFRDLYQPFPVSVAKLKRLIEKQTQGIRLPSTIPLQSAGASQNADFSLERIAFPLRTNRKAGTTFLGISVWYHGTPIEEITLHSVCVKVSDNDSCGNTPLQPTAFEGFDSAMLPSLDHVKQGQPAAALHFIDFGSLGTEVVLKCNTCPRGSDYFSWRIGKRLEDIAAELKGSILSTVDISTANSNPAWLATAGKAISGLLLFGDDQEQSDQARKKLVGLMSTPVQGNAPALFVRSINNGSDPFFLLPLGLASLAVNGTNEYIGLHFRIETPLMNADYTTGPCIDRWRLLIPNDMVAQRDSALGPGKKALKGALDDIGTLPKCSAQSNPKACLFDDIAAFSDWVNTAPEQPSTALLLLSHHSDNQLFWDKTNPVPASLFHARFRSPSIVVFNACGTAKPGETQIIRNLNLNGVSSVIATYAEVPGSMAGRFSSILIDLIQKKKADSSYLLSQAVYDAIIKLHEEPIDQTGLPLGTLPPGTKYGPFALLFGLVGNGGVRVCIP